MLGMIIDTVAFSARAIAMCSSAKNATVIMLSFALYTLARLICQDLNGKPKSDK